MQLYIALSSTDQAVAVLVVLVIVGAARPALGSRPAGVEDQQGRHRQPSHILTYTIIGPQSYTDFPFFVSDFKLAN